MEAIDFKFTGVCPMIMHNGHTADPINPWAKKLKELNAPRKKTDEQYQLLADIEFLSSLYTEPAIPIEEDNSECRIIIPDYMIEASIINGAKKIRKGTQFKGASFVAGNSVLDFPNKDKSPTELHQLGTYTFKCIVRIGAVKVPKTRVKFNQWSLKTTVMFDPDLITREEVIQSCELAGVQCGIGTWRPKHGRFSVEVI